MCYARRQRSSWARIKLSSKLYLNLSVKTLFVELVWLFILCWVCPESVIDSRFFFQRNFEILSHQAFACTLISCCSIVNDPRGFLRYSVPCFAQPEHYITSFPICQGVFQKFFKNFFNHFSAGAEVPDYYITSSRVCQEVFQKFFQLFSWFFSRPSLAVARSLTACIL